MSTIRLILFFLISSTLFSSSIEYTLNNNSIKIIDKHFIVNNSNAVINKDNLIFDIYRLQFIANNQENIKYEIKDIEWVNINYKVNNIDFDLINITNSFNYKSCPMVYIDIIPFKVDDNNNLFYMKSIDIIFYSDNIPINQFCTIADEIINKDYVNINIDSTFNNYRDINYLVITNSELESAAELLQLIHDDLNIEILDINDIVDLYSNQDLEIEDMIRNYFY